MVVWSYWLSKGNTFIPIEFMLLLIHSIKICEFYCRNRIQNKWPKWRNGMNLIMTSFLSVIHVWAKRNRCFVFAHDILSLSAFLINGTFSRIWYLNQVFMKFLWLRIFSVYAVWRNSHVFFETILFWFHIKNSSINCFEPNCQWQFAISNSNVKNVHFLSIFTEIISHT